MTDPSAPTPAPGTSPSAAELAALPVGAVMDHWPVTVPVFVRRRMACPGCVMAPFMTVAETAEAYGIDCDALVAELHAALARDRDPTTP